MKLLLLIFIAEAATLALAWRIIFPRNDDGFSDNCTLPNGAPGICRNSRYCPETQVAKAQPKHCYFEKAEEFVCCIDQTAFEKHSPTEHLYNTRISAGRAMEDRVSTIVCENSYPIKFSVASNKDPNPKEFPYMIALGYETLQSNSFEYKCGGVLISENFMLTAAHCAKLNDLAPVIALRGGESLSDRSAVKHSIDAIIIHPDYNSTFAYNDIALIKLKKPINVNYNSQEFACIWNNLELPDDKVAAISFADNASSQLIKNDLTVISNTDCNKYFDANPIFLNDIIDTQICAENLHLHSHSQRETCHHGDAGGPLIMQAVVNSVDGMVNTLFSRPYIVGIISFSPGCAGRPGVYTRVSAYIDWIENIVWPRKPAEIKQDPYY